MNEGITRRMLIRTAAGLKPSLSAPCLSPLVRAVSQEAICLPQVGRSRAIPRSSVMQKRMGSACVPCHPY